GVTEEFQRVQKAELIQHSFGSEFATPNARLILKRRLEESF
ncbi:hypothetical protein A2U01_0086098, partial [Trifolium medium]|nr:hypothetical protein [Trifolium medium]